MSERRTGPWTKAEHDETRARLDRVDSGEEDGPMTTHVVRRKTPNAKGARYFCNTGPAQGHVEHATRFTEEDANTAHQALREPHLWEVLHVSDAAAMDMKIAVDLKREMGAPRRDPRGRLTMMLALSAAASTIVDVPRGRT